MKRSLLVISLLFALAAPSFAVTTSKWLITQQSAAPTAARFYNPIGAQGNATQANGYGIMPTGGALTTFTAYMNTDPGAGNTFIVTFQNELADTVATCTVTGDGFAIGPYRCTWTGSIALVQGNRVEFSVTPTGAPNSSRMAINATFQPTTDGETVFMANSAGTITSGTAFYSLAGSKTLDADSTKMNIVMPTSGTFSKLCPRISSAVSAAQQRNFTLLKNASTTALTVQYLNADGSGVKCDNTHTVSVVAGDLIAIQSDPGGTTPSAASGAVGVVFTPTTAGDFVLPEMNTSDMVNSALRYLSVSSMDTTAPATNENNVAGIGFADFAIKHMRVALSAAPGMVGDGKSYTFVARVNFTSMPNGKLTCQVLDALTVCDSGANVEMIPIDNQDLSTMITPAGTPAAVRASVSYLASTVFTAVPNPCTYNAWLDFSGGVDAATIDAVSIANAGYGLNAPSITLAGVNGNLTFATAAQAAIEGLGAGTLCRNAKVGTTDTLGFRLVAADNTVRNIQLNYPTTAALGNGQPLASAATTSILFKTDMPASGTPILDILDIRDSGTFYVNAVLRQAGGQLLIAAEFPGDGALCLGHPSQTGDAIPISASTWYRLTLRYSTDLAGLVPNILAVYTYPGDVMVDHIISVTSCTSTKAVKSRIGYYGGGDFGAGGNLYFDQWLTCYTGTCAQPLVPDASGGASTGGMMLTGVGRDE